MTSRGEVNKAPINPAALSNEQRLNINFDRLAPPRKSETKQPQRHPGIRF